MEYLDDIFKNSYQNGDFSRLHRLEILPREFKTSKTLQADKMFIWYAR